MKRDRVIVAQTELGTKVVVWLWKTGQVEVSLRGRHGESWGQPLRIIEDSWKVAECSTRSARSSAS